MGLKELYTISQSLKNSELMPLLFVGHGSPMNAIEKNEFSESWIEIGKSMPLPTAILCISAHWETKGTQVTMMQNPQTIHDFGGFPQALFDVEYPAQGNPVLAEELKQMVTSTNVSLNNDWGLDHGTWSILKHIYPQANIPVIQLSIDYTKDAKYHYELAKELALLRSKGVLIMGSGNLIHNLRMAQYSPVYGFNGDYAYEWAAEINQLFKEKIANGDHQSLIEFEKLHPSIKLAVPTVEHYLPLLYILALQADNENVTFFNDKVVAGSLSMTSTLIC